MVVLRSKGRTESATWLPEAKYGKSKLLDYVAGGADYTLSDRRVSTAPEVAASLAAVVEHPINDDFAITGRLQAPYQSKVYTGASSPFTQDAFTLLNANIGVKSLEGWQVELWGQNLTDERYVTATFPTPVRTGDFNACVGSPRTDGVSLRGGF